MPSDTAIDNKLIKKHYPNTNNDQELSFLFEGDPNLCLLKNKISIHMIIELDEKYVPDIGFGPKQFSSLTVELNSQKVSNNKTTGESQRNLLNISVILSANFSVSQYSPGLH